MNNENEFIRLNDLYASAYLLANDVSLENIEKDKTGRATFVFLKTSQSQQLLQQFIQLRARVEPTSFVLAQKRLKQLLYLPTLKDHAVK